MDYHTHWIEENIIKNCTTKVVTDFLEEHIITRLRMSFSLMYDNESSFASVFLTQWALENKLLPSSLQIIIHKEMA